MGPTYGSTRLLELVEWLYHDDEPEDVYPSAMEMDVAVTRVASAEEIRQRRSMRDAGRVVRPAPPGIRKAKRNKPGFTTLVKRIAKRLLDHDTSPDRS